MFNIYDFKELPDVLKASLEESQKSNPHFSLRPFAQKLNIYPSMLSQIFKKNTKISQKILNQFCNYKDFNLEEKKHLNLLFEFQRASDSHKESLNLTT